MRIACEVCVGDRRHSGLVLNVSPGGLFVQTHARPTSGDTIGVALNMPGCNEAMTLDATVVWKRVVPAGVLPLAQGGVGVSLLNPPEGYFEFLAAVARPREDASQTAIPLEASSDSPLHEAADGRAIEPTESYKVRVAFGQRSRVLSVSAVSDNHAREVALASAGEGWKVIVSERRD